MGVRIRTQSVKHMWLWQVFEHSSNRNGANVLFHQLKQLYSMCRVLHQGPVLCLNQRVLVSIYVQMLVLCVFLLDVFVHLCSKCYNML